MLLFTSSLLFYFFLFGISTCAPFLKPSNEATTGWVSDPNGRVTFSLVVSCLLTLSLCVWSAMHLNIPRPYHLTIQEFIRGIKWGVVGIFTPELVVFAAWRQYNSATALKALVQDRIAEAVTPFPTEQSHTKSSELDKKSTRVELQDIISPWTIVHGFYAGMGGFVFDFENSEDNTPQFIPNYQRLTLTACGVNLLAECGYLPDITRREILDKSKADTMAKLLVILQAGWMLVQVIGRLVTGLPVTFLEGDWVRPLCAYMYMSSQISGHDSKHPGILKRSWKDSELSRFAYVPPMASDGLQEGLKIQRTPSSLIPEKSHTFEINAATTELYESAQISTFGFFVPSRSDLNANGSSKRDPDQTENTKYLLNASLEQHTLSLSAGNWPGEDLLRSTGGLVMGMTLWLASIAFGAVHAAAWYDYFPSCFEQWMWRASAVYIAFSGISWLCINGLARAIKPVDQFWDRFLALKEDWCSFLVIGFLCTVCGISYVVARIYLVVEAFISIRKLPVGAYGTPDWTTVVPHL
ncbi:uncharacterized protein EAE97_000068 [Botrytis byssoidea]|uniref:Uncharacterized protein n=1 Tax=Botrytis byssoidea TaxID=139641 RepID=A0A9P5M9N8_9HELO|nr:uncharacterized protein EAE97_000068 [Botrytis byssoidea]KAF7954809.1 hypothetical protein EAE97_000068 [Botrytis byssoidea]